ncbi:hypothetical protein [Limobrevibacterium gyesilva]|uniref:Aa3-type cytochrome c oxidase subunit IV n=1 Tax=Limobrevibacterium gyesilva TaxID=2991712 RepID=A0AA42CFU7_9PROT|nr:hypothetical protein [Limobrevibacterium gyesilva]MCW3473165.1 hypothetical protein [Limobrevibacterium gyesilva]
MAQSPMSDLPPVTEEAFVANRQQVWASFCGFTTGTVIVAVAILVLMAIFLL